MDDQLLLGVEPSPDREIPETTQSRFEEFHRSNPEVYHGLVKLAWKARHAGRKTIGIAQLYEVLRWDWMLEGVPFDHDGYKLNNNHKSRYARLIMEQVPGLEGIFKIRRLTT